MSEQWFISACVQPLEVSSNRFGAHSTSVSRYGITCSEGIVFIKSNLKLVYTSYTTSFQLFFQTLLASFSVIYLLHD